VAGCAAGLKAAALKEVEGEGGCTVVTGAGDHMLSAGGVAEGFVLGAFHHTCWDGVGVRVRVRFKSTQTLAWLLSATGSGQRSLLAYCQA